MKVPAAYPLKRMLGIIYKTNTGQLMEVQWSVGTPSPFVGPHFNTPYFVGEVIADGDELEYIKVTFENLPKANKKQVRYLGDHAKFIAANLP